MQSDADGTVVLRQHEVDQSDRAAVDEAVNICLVSAIALIRAGTRT
jgi:hypothetical protein